MLAVLLFLFSPFVHADPMSITVARVADHIITSREVQMESLMEKVLYSNAKGLTIYSVKSKEFSDETNETILEWALATEAKSFDVVQTAEHDYRMAESRLSKDLFGLAVWKSLEASPAEWKAVLENKLKAKQFIKFRRESSELPVTDTEAKAYFEENRAKFGALPFDNFKEDIKAFLARSQVDRRLKDWYEVVKAKYQAKNFLAEL
jgi:hypothetical protein